MVTTTSKFTGVTSDYNKGITLLRITFSPVSTWRVDFGANTDYISPC